ncbi:MAG TPA: TIGR02265 family protein [Thermoanaerobaculia bacterium]|nr:TIGR02265 family protein [Thermoanaerobaculia bacterium]
MPGRVKGGALVSRLEFVRERGGEAAVKGVLSRLSEEDRKVCSQLLTASWYPFELNARLDEAIAAEVGIGERVFLLMGEKSAAHNLSSAHRAFVTERDPHGLLRRTAQIYQAYYDTGHRDYEKSGEKKAILRTWESESFSAHDCLTIVGWHRKAVEMCGGKNVRVTETRCRAKGATVCEYVCEWD